MQLRALHGAWDMAGTSLPRRLFRNVRLMVPVCIALICSCFAAAAVLNMRLERMHALAQAAYFEQARAADLASVAGAALDRFAAAGVAFAHDPGARIGDPAIRNIAIFRGTALIAAARPGSALPAPPAFAAPRGLFRFGPEAGFGVA